MCEMGITLSLSTTGYHPRVPDSSHARKQVQRIGHAMWWVLILTYSNSIHQSANLHGRCARWVLH